MPGQCWCLAIPRRLRKYDCKRIVPFQLKGTGKVTGKVLITGARASLLKSVLEGRHFTVNPRVSTLDLLDLLGGIILADIESANRVRVSTRRASRYLRSTISAQTTTLRAGKIKGRQKIGAVHTRHHQRLAIVPSLSLPMSPAVMSFLMITTQARAATRALESVWQPAAEFFQLNLRGAIFGALYERHLTHCSHNAEAVTPKKRAKNRTAQDPRSWLPRASQKLDPSALTPKNKQALAALAYVVIVQGRGTLDDLPSLRLL